MCRADDALPPRANSCRAPVRRPDVLPLRQWPWSGCPSFGRPFPGGTEETMREASSHEPSSRPPYAQATTVADIMRPPATTVEQNDHVAAAAYLMKHAGATALVVMDYRHTNRPIGLITEADIVQVVADGTDLNDVRLYALMAARPPVINAANSIRDAARTMTAGRLP